jgi:hypothetical protein
MAENEGNEKPKIIVDDDWKTQAKAEKEKLSEEVDKKTDKAEQAGAMGAGGRDIPPASFTTLISSLVTQILMALGGMADPQSGQRYVDLELAKFHVDTLSVLEEKTRGNLDDDEQKTLDKALYETRMHYVQVAQAVSEQLAAAGKKAGPAAGQTPPTPDIQA